MNLEEMKRLTIEKYEKVLRLIGEDEWEAAFFTHLGRCVFCKQFSGCKGCKAYHLCHDEGSLHDRILKNGTFNEDIIVEMIEELKKIG